MRRMDDADRLEAKGLARAKIRAKRRRTQAIRRRTIRGSLALFAIVWTIVFAQLASGNDPALSRTPHKHQRAAAKQQPAPRAEPVPEEEFAEPEVEAVPVEEVPAEPEPEAVPVEEVPAEPEPEPVVTASS